MKLLQRFGADKKGATAIEYGLIAGLVSVAIIVSLQLLGTQLTAAYTNIATAIATALGI